MDIKQTNQSIGRPTFLCRWICSGLLAAPLLYWWSLGYKADALFLLILALLSLIAGLVLLVNSTVCLFRYRNKRQLLICIVFAFVSVLGVVMMVYVLPGWKM